MIMVGEHEYFLKFKIQVLKYFKWFSEFFKNLSPLLHIHRDKSYLSVYISQHLITQQDWMS